MSKNDHEVPSQPSQGLDSWVSLKVARVPRRFEPQAREYHQKVKALQEAQEDFEDFRSDPKVFAKLRQDLQNFLYVKSIYAKVSIAFSLAKSASIVVILTRIDGDSVKAAQLGQNFLDAKPSLTGSNYIRWDIPL